MTFREKLQQEHPEKCNDCAIGGCADCPSTYGYEPPKGEDGEDICEEFYNTNDNEDALCTKCWDREIPEGLEKIKTLQESALKALEYDESMKNGEWVTRGGGLESREKDGRIEFRYTGPTVSNEEPAGDPVNAPSHYNAGGYECWDVMEAVFGKEAVYHFALCNAFKYLWRAGKKDDLLQDLRKAAKNLEKAIKVKEE